MIPFPFNKNRFSFFVADHLLVGQLCTNPKSNWSLLSCLKVTQCSTSEIGDAPLYNSCPLPIQVLTARTIAGLPRITGTCPGGWSFRLRLWFLVWFQVRANHATSHLWSQFESQHQSVPGCAEEYGDPLVQSGDRWQTLGVIAGLSTGPQVQRDAGLASEGVLRLCTLLSQPPSPPTWTCWTTSFGHTSRTSPTWPPTTPKFNVIFSWDRHIHIHSGASAKFYCSTNPNVSWESPTRNSRDHLRETQLPQLYWLPAID